MSATIEPSPLAAPTCACMRSQVSSDGEGLWRVPLQPGAGFDFGRRGRLLVSGSGGSSAHTHEVHVDARTVARVQVPTAGGKPPTPPHPSFPAAC